MPYSFMHFAVSAIVPTCQPTDTRFFFVSENSHSSCYTMPGCPILPYFSAGSPVNPPKESQMVVRCNLVLLQPNSSVFIYLLAGIGSN